jgi:hypothetical protein
MLPLSSLSASTNIAYSQDVEQLSSSVTLLNNDNSYSIEFYKKIYDGFSDVGEDLEYTPTLEDLSAAFNRLVNIFTTAFTDIGPYSEPTPPAPPALPTVTYMVDTTTGNTEGLSPDCTFMVSGMNLFLDQSDLESGFYINTSSGQSLKCEIVTQNTSVETGICEYVLINPISFTDSASYLTYKQLASNGSYYIVRYPNNGTFSIE